MYLVFVTIFSEPMTERLDAHREDAAASTDGGGPVRLEKCTFFDAAVFYLGHTIRPGQLEGPEAETGGHQTSSSPDKPK